MNGWVDYRESSQEAALVDEVAWVYIAQGTSFTSLIVWLAPLHSGCDVWGSGSKGHDCLPSLKNIFTSYVNVNCHKATAPRAMGFCYTISSFTLNHPLHEPLNFRGTSFEREVPLCLQRAEVGTKSLVCTKNGHTKKERNHRVHHSPDIIAS